MKHNHPSYARRVGLLASGFVFVASCVALVPEVAWNRVPRFKRAFCDWSSVCFHSSQINAGLNGLRGDPGTTVTDSVATLRSALVNDPASPYRWADLGEAYLMSGDAKTAERCFLRGFQLAPKSPGLEFRLAAFYLRTGADRQALAHMANLLRQSRKFDEIVFSYLDRMGFSAQSALDSAIPADAGAVMGFFQYLRSAGRRDDTLVAWLRFTANGWAEEKEAKRYAEELLAAHDVAATAQAWSAYRNGIRGRGKQTNLVGNAGFENPPSGLVFDWSIEKNDQAVALRDCRQGHGGGCSLRIRFDARENLQYQGVSQPLVVSSGSYRFTAFLKTDDITTDQGVRFRIVDRENPSRFEIVTEAVRGTQDWRELTGRFRVPAETQLVVLQVIRSRSDKFENRIKGTAWIDDVSVIAEDGR